MKMQMLPIILLVAILGTNAQEKEEIVPADAGVPADVDLGMPADVDLGMPDEMPESEGEFAEEQGVYGVLTGVLNRQNELLQTVDELFDRVGRIEMAMEAEAQQEFGNEIAGPENDIVEK